uniref:Non-symbiotic hemoglobin 2 n=1 Tax=Tanacetum cinerariifolium TaxID=118510 RepID=A0A6L2LP46_TANCI|nr:non-symbiotic hemoglobin 2 [Tanacetum cinerariifolium]
MAGFSEKQEALVKESWMVMKEDIPALSLYLYKMILEIAFSFLKDTTELPQNNPKLKSHAVKVFKMVCEAAIQLREKGEVVILDKNTTRIESYSFTTLRRPQKW